MHHSDLTCPLRCAVKQCISINQNNMFGVIQTGKLTENIYIFEAITHNGYCEFKDGNNFIYNTICDEELANDQAISVKLRYPDENLLLQFPLAHIDIGQDICRYDDCDNRADIILLGKLFIAFKEDIKNWREGPEIKVQCSKEISHHALGLYTGQCLATELVLRYLNDWQLFSNMSEATDNFFSMIMSRQPSQIARTQFDGLKDQRQLQQDILECASIGIYGYHKDALSYKCVSSGGMRFVSQDKSNSTCWLMPSNLCRSFQTVSLGKTYIPGLRDSNGTIQRTTARTVYATSDKTENPFFKELHAAEWVAYCFGCLFLVLASVGVVSIVSMAVSPGPNNGAMRYCDDLHSGVRNCCRSLREAARTIFRRNRHRDQHIETGTELQTIVYTLAAPTNNTNAEAAESQSLLAEVVANPVLVPIIEDEDNIAETNIDDVINSQTEVNITEADNNFARSHNTELSVSSDSIQSVIQVESGINC